MGMRITTGMAMNTYRYNLQLSTSNLNNAQNTVLTHRKFNSFSDDPSSAIQAWRVRRAMTDVGSYQSGFFTHLSLPTRIRGCMCAVLVRF